MLVLAAITFLMASNPASPKPASPSPGLCIVDSQEESREMADCDEREEISFSDEEIAFEDELAYDEEDPLEVQEIVFDDDGDMEMEDPEQED